VSSQQHAVVHGLPRVRGLGVATVKMTRRVKVACLFDTATIRRRISVHKGHILMPLGVHPPALFFLLWRFIVLSQQLSGASSGAATTVRHLGGTLRRVAYIRPAVNMHN